MSKLPVHDNTTIVNDLVEGYKQLFHHYSGTARHVALNDASTPTDATGIMDDVLNESISMFVDMMTYAASAEKVATWNEEGRFAIALANEKMDNVRLPAFLSPSFTEGSSVFGLALIPTVSTDENDRLYEDNTKLKLMSFVNDGGDVRLYSDLSALIESESTPRMFDASTTPINGAVVDRLTSHFDETYHPQLNPEKGAVLVSRLSGDAHDPSEVKREVNEKFGQLLERLARRIDTLSNPNVVDADEQIYWISPVVTHGRRMFQIVDEEGTHQLDEPMAHRGQVYALCLQMNVERNDED